MIAQTLRRILIVQANIRITNVCLSDTQGKLSHKQELPMILIYVSANQAGMLTTVIDLFSPFQTM